MRFCKLAPIVIALLVAQTLLPLAALANDPVLIVTPAEGEPGSPIVLSGSGFDSGASVDILWYTVEGNRVSGRGFVEINHTIVDVTADSSGNFQLDTTVPYDLGGPAHRIEAVVAGKVVASDEFTITRNAWISPTEGPEGTVITFHMVGGGWTHFDNNIAVTYDNSFLGFACSFNSQGNITLHLQASGGVGTHIIAVYPALYYGPSDGPTPFKHAALNSNDLPVKYEPMVFEFEITESDGPTRSYVGATNLVTAYAPDSLAVTSLPAVAPDDGTPHLVFGNGGIGISGTEVSYALSGFSPNAQVDLRWNTITGETEIGGDLGDKFRGWVFTPTNWTLGRVTASSEGKASGTVSIPYDYGGDHLLEAVVGDEVIASTTWRVVPHFSASISEDGSQVLLHGTGLGWEKYTAVWDVLYDSKLGGWVSALTSNGNVTVGIYAVGTPGVHTIDIHEGSNGWPYLNMHESPWPWEPVYRFSFTIHEPETAPAGSGVSLSLEVSILLILVAVIAAFLAGSMLSRRSSGELEPDAETRPDPAYSGKAAEKSELKETAVRGQERMSD